MSSDGLRGFIKKNEDVINTTGHIVSYVQNRKLQANQESLARLEQVNLALLNKQNMLKEQELNKLEELKSSQEKEKAEEKRKAKLKEQLLEIAPKTKGLIRYLEEEDSVNQLERSFLSQHAKISIEIISQNKNVIDDINFHDYYFELRTRVDRLSESNNGNEDLLKKEGDELASKLIEIESFLVSTELLSKELKDIYVERNEFNEGFLKDLVANVKNDLEKENLFLEIKEILVAYKNLKNVLLKFDEPYNIEYYFLPMSFLEVDDLLQQINLALDDNNNFLNAISKKIQSALTLGKKDHKPVINRFEEILNKKWIDISYEDLQFLEKNIDYENIGFFKGTLDIMLKEYKNFLEKISNEIENLKDSDFHRKLAKIQDLKDDKKISVLISHSDNTEKLQKVKLKYICGIAGFIFFGILTSFISESFILSFLMAFIPGVFLFAGFFTERQSLVNKELRLILNSIEESLILARNIISKL